LGHGEKGFDAKRILKLTFFSTFQPPEENLLTPLATPLFACSPVSSLRNGKKPGRACSTHISSLRDYDLRLRRPGDALPDQTRTHDK
jgi:hypothetical protein